MPERTPSRARRASGGGTRHGATRKRAIYDDEKEARRGAMLASARQLLLEHDGRLATVTEVADRAGVAKGTVYLYFQTKEELYVAQYEELMIALLARMREVCASRRSDADVRAGIVDAICRFVAAQPELLRLGSLMNGVLEQNVSDEFIEGYKSRLGTALIETANALVEALQPLSMAEATQLVLRTYAMSIGLWQQADLPGVVRRLLKRRPDLGFYEIEFGAELRSALELLWRPPLRSA
jgi:TetR/AcrR family transcriptional regulator